MDVGKCRNGTGLGNGTMVRAARRKTALTSYSPQKAFLAAGLLANIAEQPCFTRSQQDELPPDCGIKSRARKATPAPAAKAWEVMSDFPHDRFNS
jgi:hypothetical protein